jgi:hypothetical protein
MLYPICAYLCLQAKPEAEVFSFLHDDAVAESHEEHWNVRKIFEAYVIASVPFLRSVSQKVEIQGLGLSRHRVHVRECTATTAIDDHDVLEDEAEKDVRLRLQPHILLRPIEERSKCYEEASVQKRMCISPSDSQPPIRPSQE